MQGHLAYARCRGWCLECGMGFADEYSSNRAYLRLLTGSRAAAFDKPGVRRAQTLRAGCICAKAKWFQLGLNHSNARESVVMPYLGRFFSSRI